ncbi:MAG: hypothetical protein U0797_12635 [Gemmataceae bacterium]
MKVLVANLGSTSFKYRLFDMSNEKVLARGGVERIGSAESKAFVESGGAREELTVQAKDHAVAVRLCLEQLSDPKRACLRDPSELAAIGFKAVHAKDVTGVQASMSGCWPRWRSTPTSPRHNPPYIAAMRLLNRELAADPARGGVRDGVPRDDPAGPQALRRPAGVGAEVRHRAAGASTAPATATSPAGRRNCSASRARRSSRATSAAAPRCAPSRPGSRWPTCWA